MERASSVSSRDASPNRPIPAPAGTPAVLYGPGDTLQCSMGLQDDLETFTGILVTIREVWRAHGVDRNIPYVQQDPAVMRNVVKETVKRIPCLGMYYEDAWPVTVYLKKTLRRGPGEAEGKGEASSARSNTTSPQKTGPRRSTRKRIQTARAAGAEAQSATKRAAASTTEGRRYNGSAADKRRKVQSRPSRPSNGASNSRARVNARFAVRRGRSASSREGQSESSSSSDSASSTGSNPFTHRTCSEEDEARSSDDNMTHSSQSQSPPTRARRTASSTSKKRTHDAAHTTRLTNTNYTRFISRRSKCTGVLDHLLRFSIPRADAEHLAAVFTSFGITNTTYLRVMARLESRDAWLRELREEGVLSEIQMRVLREMLACVAATAGPA